MGLHMLEIFEIKSRNKNYTVEINNKKKFNLNRIIKNNFSIIDKKLLYFYPELRKTKKITIQALEKNKSLETVQKILKDLKTQKTLRDHKIYSIGGGIVQDVSTLSASLYMRGIKWVYIPTTLLSMIDSCIGGKSSININNFKNIVGNFYPPDYIIIYVNFYKSLKDYQLIEGLCEGIKICYAHSYKSFKKFINLIDLNKPLKKLPFFQLISLSLKSKKFFIENDEFDNGKRLLLNFGHTFGHSLEASSNYKISHGYSVGLGMLAAIDLSIKLKFVSKTNTKIQLLNKFVSKILDKDKKVFKHVKNLNINKTFEKFKLDKKHKRNAFTLILFDNYGNLKKTTITNNFKNCELIKSSLNSLKNKKLI